MNVHGLLTEDANLHGLFHRSRLRTAAERLFLQDTKSCPGISFEFFLQIEMMHFSLVLAALNAAL